MSAAVTDGGQLPRPAGTAPWRGLLRASARQHRTGLVTLAGYYAGCAALMLVISLLLEANLFGWVPHLLVALLTFYAGVRLFGPAGFIIGPISAVVIRAGARFLLGPPLIPTSRTG